MSFLKNIVVTCVAFMALGIFAALALNVSFLNPIALVIKDFSITDIFYQIVRDTSQPATSGLITIVDMSSLTSRRDLAQALNVIEVCSPKVVGVDVVFEGLKDDVLGDEQIANVAQKNKNMVFSYRLLENISDNLQKTVAVHSFFADSLAVSEGFSNIQRQLYGGMKRELSLGRDVEGELYPSFVTQVANEFAGKKIENVEERNLNINFMPTHFEVVNCDSIKQNYSLLADRVVLFGAMQEEQDMHYTPLGKMAGVELQAYSIQTLLEQKEIKTVPNWLLWPLSFLIVLITQWWQALYINFIDHRRNQYVRFYCNTRFFRTWITFIWMALLMWIAFIVFAKFNISFNLGWAFSAIVLLELARGAYDAHSKSRLNKKEKRRIR